MERPDLARAADVALTFGLSLSALACASGARPAAQVSSTKPAAAAVSSGAAAAVSSGAAAGVSSGAAAGERGQWLFRAEVDGPDGGGTLRLTLRDYGDGRFELGAADAVGQSRWRLIADGDEAILLDIERRRFCRLAAAAPFALPRLRLALPVASLPRLLRRELPVAPVGEPTSEGAIDFVDTNGARWTATRTRGVWRGWTLWGEGGPRLWARLEGGEATLSSREPAFQMRWRETAREPLPADAQPPEAPESGFDESDCDDAAAA